MRTAGTQEVSHRGLHHTILTAVGIGFGHGPPTDAPPVPVFSSAIVHVCFPYVFFAILHVQHQVVYVTYCAYASLYLSRKVGVVVWLLRLLLHTLARAV